MDYIELNNMTFHAFHGVFPQERKTGNKFTVSLRIYSNLNTASESDRLTDAINYAAIFEIVKHEMEIPSNLLEHVAGRIIRAIKEQFPEIKSVKIRLSKHHPPVAGQMEEAAVVMFA
ncbi:MAG: dihydroneopterin aldolase [Dysgonamonadaceae bacterium]|jgi:dihydroneopterin aldolase|nr:dihydroneopterin aldolase [Dysgonamonadaceae bacterium]